MISWLSPQLHSSSTALSYLWRRRLPLLVHGIVPATPHRLSYYLSFGFFAYSTGASWGKFWHTGKFLSRVDFAFIAPHPVQVFHWIGSDIIVIIVASTLVPALAFSFWIPSLIKSWSPTSIGELYSGFGERQYTRYAFSDSLCQASRRELRPVWPLLSDLRWSNKVNDERRICALTIEQTLP